MDTDYITSKNKCLGKEMWVEIGQAQCFESPGLAKTMCRRCIFFIMFLISLHADTNYVTNK